MIKNFVLAVGIIVFSIVSVHAQNQCPVIPLPDKFASEKESFLLSNQTVLEADSGLDEVLYVFKNMVLKYLDIPLSGKETGGTKIILKREKSAGVSDEERYSIDMNSSSVTITAGGAPGLFYGLMSFMQIASNASKDNGTLQVECWNIEDAPLYGWRGFMLDESRHFFGINTVKDILDYMALLKLNKFHWHLTDEPGWRIEIKKYPRLGLVGGVGDFSDSTATTRYYTQSEIREIVKYAAERQIEIIPEIDMPGHATAANRAYPEFSGGWTEKNPHFTFNPGKEGTYNYLTDILREVSVLFPTDKIHLGGDEVSFGIKSWETNPDVIQLRKDRNLKGLKEVEWYFFERMTDTALTLFDKIMAWDEAVDSDLSPERSIIYWWRHDKTEQLQKALSKGYPVILTPRIPMYFDFVQDEDHRQGRRWAGEYASVKQVYEFSDKTYSVPEGYDRQILGIQASLWTERISSEKRLQFMIYPRMAALAEAAWTQPAHRDYSRFQERLDAHYVLLRKEGIYYFNPADKKMHPEVLDYIPID